MSLIASAIASSTSAQTIAPADTPWKLSGDNPSFQILVARSDTSPVALTVCVSSISPGATVEVQVNQPKHDVFVLNSKCSTVLSAFKAGQKVSVLLKQDRVPLRPAEKNDFAMVTYSIAPKQWVSDISSTDTRVPGGAGVKINFGGADPDVRTCPTGTVAVGFGHGKVNNDIWLYCSKLIAK